MTDITLCLDTKCPTRKDCERYAGNKRKEMPHEGFSAYRWSSYADFHRKEDDELCESFEPMRKQNETKPI